MPKNITVTVDGSSKRQHARVGFVIRDAITGNILESVSRDVGRGTSNEAEYYAIILGLGSVERYAPEKVVLYTDSQLIVRQMKGDYRVSQKLRPLYTHAKRALQAAKARLVWHRRDDGDGPLADSLATLRTKEDTDGHGTSVDKGRHRAEVTRRIEGERVQAYRTPRGA